MEDPVNVATVYPPCSVLVGIARIEAEGVARAIGRVRQVKICIIITKDIMYGFEIIADQYRPESLSMLVATFRASLPNKLKLAYCCDLTAQQGQNSDCASFA